MVSFVCAVPVGAWRSLVAHLHGVQGAVSSNLTAPTIHRDPLSSLIFPCLFRAASIAQLRIIHWAKREGGESQFSPPFNWM